MRRAAFQLVGLGEQDMAGRAGCPAPGEHLLVERAQRVADVHDQYHAAQAAAPVEILLHHVAPVGLQLFRHLGEAIPGKICNAPFAVDFEDRALFRREAQFDQRESEANAFASKLLMPETEFRTVVVGRRASLDDLARHFGVSSAAVKFRAEALGEERIFG